MSKLNLDYLPKSKMKLYQGNDTFKINTATYLLSEFMKIKNGESVLDIGTNNGALLLEASQMTQGLLVGVEIIKEAALIAEKNVKLHNLTNVKIINIDIKDFYGESFDVIVSNPPYFKDYLNNSLKNFKQIATQEVALSLEVLLNKINEL